MYKWIGIIFLLVATCFAKPISIDYDNHDDNGNVINDDVNLQSLDYYYGDDNKNNELITKREPEIYRSDKRNILSALRSKMRRSNMPIEDSEEKNKFAAILSVDAFNNLNGFFDNLATNLHTMESRNLLPNQMRLLGENNLNEYRTRTDPYSHSAAFINSVRSYAPNKSIRKLLAYQPGVNSYHSHPLITSINQVHRKDRS